MGIVLLSPFFILIGLIVKLSSTGTVFFLQDRVGLNGKTFRIIKFRTMYANSEVKGELTIGGKDPRVTGFGYFLRKFKLDELPQLFNVLVGEMSFVGPRPEVPKYVKLYDNHQKSVLKIKPGITDNASIEFRNENELLEKSDNPEEYYISQIMPLKIKINLDYIKRRSFIGDLDILWRTFLSIFR